MKTSKLAPDAAAMRQTLMNVVAVIKWRQDGANDWASTLSATDVRDLFADIERHGIKVGAIKGQKS